MNKINTDRVDVIGVPISATNLNNVVSDLTNYFDGFRGRYICVSNAHTTVMAHDDEAYYRVQTESILSVPDGKPLSLIGKRVKPEMGRVTGPDLMRAVFESESLKDRTHYFYGNTKENLDFLISKVQEDYPDLIIAGFEPSVFRPLADTEKLELCQRIDQAKADFVWMGLGAPRQEILCNELMGQTNSLMIGVGGAFNILANITPEAPIWLQNLSLEWLYRLLQEPRRLFKRYFVTNTKFIIYYITNLKPKFKR